MDAFHISHEVLRAPRRRTQSEFGFPSISTRGRVTFTAIFPVAGQLQVQLFRMYQTAHIKKNNSVDDTSVGLDNIYDIYQYDDMGI